MIRIENVHKKYGDLDVLKGVHLEIKKSEVLAIVGASGAGKSTLLQIIGTLDTQIKGRFGLKTKMFSSSLNPPSINFEIPKSVLSFNFIIFYQNLRH